MAPHSDGNSFPSNRREFLQRAVMTTSAAALPVFSQSAAQGGIRPDTDDISLAAWSLIVSFRAGRWKNLDLPKICREEFDINGVEFVNTLFEVPTYRYLQTLKRNLAVAGVRAVLIMIDSEGGMAAVDSAHRALAVRNHQRWLDIAHDLGCHGIRANVQLEPGRSGDSPGPGSPDDVRKRATESFTALAEYAADAGMNVMIENHGGLSSDPTWLASLMQAVSLPNFGTLPDFGNWPEQIDAQAAVRRILPYALGISVKTRMKDGRFAYDHERVIRMVHASGYRGFYGIESSARHTGMPDDFAAVRFVQKALQQNLDFG